MAALEHDSGEGDLLTSLMTPITPIRTAPLLFDAGMTRPRSQSRRLGDSPMSTPSLNAPSPRSPIIQAAAAPATMVDGPGTKRSPRSISVTTSLPPLAPIAGVPQTTTGSSRPSARLVEEGPPRLLSMRGPGPGPGSGSRLFGGGPTQRPGQSSFNPSRLRVAQEVGGEPEGEEVVAVGVADAGTGAEAGTADGALGADGGTGAEVSFRGGHSSQDSDGVRSSSPPTAILAAGPDGPPLPFTFSLSGGLVGDGQPSFTPRLTALDTPGAAQGFVVSEEALRAPKHPLRIIYAAGETFKVEALACGRLCVSV
jgi:hypothetical protein